MLIDYLAQFAVNQAVTVSAFATNLMDLGMSRDIGAGKELYLVVQCHQTMTGAGATIAASLQTSATNNGTNLSGTITTLLTMPTIPALSAAGLMQITRLPPGMVGGYQRYLQLYWTVAGGTLTAGTFSAFLTPDAQNWQAYASGFAIQ